MKSDKAAIGKIIATAKWKTLNVVQTKIERLHGEGHTIVVVSHQSGDVMSFCDRAVLLEEGRVLHQGTGKEVGEAYLDLMAG